jgi:hypothetical protein
MSGLTIREWIAEKPLRKSLNLLATGLNLTIRNATTYTRDEFSEQEGMERPAAYSFLARLLDTCEIRRAQRSEPEHPCLEPREFRRTGFYAAVSQRSRQTGHVRLAGLLDRAP